MGETALDLPREAVADNSIVQRSPHADISQMRLVLDGNSLSVSISFAKPITKAVAIELGVAFGGIGRQAVIGSLKYSMGILTGQHSDDSMESSWDSGISFSPRSNDTVFTFPMQEAGKPDWMMLWCRSYVGLRNIDQSLMHFIRLK